MKNFRCVRKVLVACVTVSLLLPTVYYTMYSNRWGPKTTKQTTELEQDRALFEGFDNVTGSNAFIVPNVVHYIRFNKNSFSFVDYVCVRSAYVNQRPERIVFHTNVGVDNFTGAYWNRIREEADFYSRIVVLPAEVPTEIFGQRLSDGWRLFHGSDIARIRIMMEHGGIYLDSDVYVVQNLDKYRKFEIAMGWDEGQFLGSQVIIAHKNARFLPLWLDTYREYHPELW